MEGSSMKQMTLLVIILSSGLLLSTAATAKPNDPPTLVNTNPAVTDAFWTPDRLATARPMGVPGASSVAFSTQIETPPSSQVIGRAAVPTLRVSGAAPQLFTPVP